jgi:hypothetical protein
MLTTIKQTGSDSYEARQREKEWECQRHHLNLLWADFSLQQCGRYGFALISNIQIDKKTHPFNWLDELWGGLKKQIDKTSQKSVRSLLRPNKTKKQVTRLRTDGWSDSIVTSFLSFLFCFFLEGREEDRCSNQISPEYSNCWQSICTITSIAIDGYRGSCIPSAHLVVVVVVAVGYSVRSILYSNPRFFFSF